jgi:arylsulfatase
VIDIVPTILEACGLAQPTAVNGIPQKPIEGLSMAYSWDKANAPGQRTTQYFEMFGSRGLYQDGWMASVPPLKPAWEASLAQPPADVMNGFPPWELYNLDADWTQADDLAAKMPDKVRDLSDAFISEATKYQVFPLDSNVLPRLLSLKPNYNAGRTTFGYSGVLSNVLLSAGGNAPSLLNRSYTITAEVEIPQDGAEGMLVTDGGRATGSICSRAGRFSLGT